MLLRIDNNIEIDMGYITCAEYQLFIDEERETGENRQPTHWESYTFLPGNAKKPIVGVRASDAEKFCEWLTQQSSASGFKYRLPTLAEAEEHRATEKQIGCWCNDGGKKAIAGVEASQWQAWRHDLDDVLIRDFNAVDALIKVLAFDQLSILSLARKFDSYTGFGLTKALNCAGVNKINAKLNNQLNRVKTSYFQNFYFAPILAEKTVLMQNILNSINRTGDDFLSSTEVLVAHRSSETHDKIEDINKKIKDLELDKYRRGTEIETVLIPNVSLEKAYNKFRKIQEKYNNSIAKIEYWERKLNKAQNYIRDLEKYKKRQTLADVTNLKIEFNEFIKKQLDESRNQVLTFKRHCSKIEPLVNNEASQREFQKAQERLVALEGRYFRIKSIENNEYYHREINDFINIELVDYYNLIHNFDRYYQQAVAEAEIPEKELGEARNQVQELEDIRDKKVAAIYKLVNSYQKTIADAEKVRLELTENYKQYEKYRSAFVHAIRLTTNRSYCLFITLLWDLLACEDKKNEAWNLYTFIVLRDARRIRQIPAWEGIRIVRERL